MFSFHKPKIYRSINGCCICRAKSSSSRFTASTKYEQEFFNCFKVSSDQRKGDICNACVLLVKRYKKLPPGTQRDWKHVVDARGGGSGSTKSVKITSKKNRSRNKDHRSTIEDGDDNIDCLRRVGSPDQSDYSDDYEFASDDEIESLEGKRRIRTSRCPSRPSKRIPRDEDNNNNDNPRISPFIDTNYWRREEICCGIIFRAGNSIVIHPKLMRPCSCRQDKNTSSSVNGSGTDQSSLASPTSSSPPSSVLVLEKKPSIGGSSSDNQSVSSSPSMLEEVDNESNASNSYASTFICV